MFKSTKRGQNFAQTGLKSSSSGAKNRHFHRKAGKFSKRNNQNRAFWHQVPYAGFTQKPQASPLQAKADFQKAAFGEEFFFGFQGGLGAGRAQLNFLFGRSSRAWNLGGQLGPRGGRATGVIGKLPRLKAGRNLRPQGDLPSVQLFARLHCKGFRTKIRTALAAAGPNAKREQVRRLPKIGKLKSA